MSFTGIGRIGSQHILNLNVATDTDNFLYTIGGDNYWCTHPIKYSVPLLSGGASMSMQVGSKIVIGGGSSEFTKLCADIQMDNKPIYRYVVAFGNNTGTRMILDIDYVIDDTTMVLKFPATVTENSAVEAYPIDYFNTMILKDVTIANNTADQTTNVNLEIVSKFGSSNIYISNHNVANEGGVEPLLITAVADANVILNY
jgi:hypothetical protein